MFTFFPLFVPSCLVKLVDWGEEGHRSAAEIASIRAAFTQEVAVWHKLDHPNVTKLSDYDVEKSVRYITYVRYDAGSDFGVARLKASNPNDMTGETGTLGYMAPEQPWKRDQIHDLLDVHGVFLQCYTAKCKHRNHLSSDLSSNIDELKCDRSLMAIPTIESAMCIVSVSAYGRYTVVTCRIPISASRSSARAGDTSMLSEFTCECNEVMLGCQPRQTTGDGRSGVNVGGH
ncbi:hypothetical protein V6N13_127321 [Hibiscus sabdariffa]